jgi:hypothetical protein
MEEAWMIQPEGLCLWVEVHLHKEPDQISALMRVQLVLDFVLFISASKRRASSPVDKSIAVLANIVLAKLGSRSFPKTARHPPSLFAAKNCRPNPNFRS